MTKKAWFLPLVCVLLISGWLAPAASASAQTALSLNDRLASSPSGTGSLLSLAAPAAPYADTDTYYEGAEGKTGDSLKSTLHRHYQRTHDAVLQRSVERAERNG